MSTAMDLLSLVCLLFVTLYPSSSYSYPEPYHSPQQHEYNQTSSPILLSLLPNQLNQQLTSAKVQPPLTFSRPNNKNNIRLGRSVPSGPTQRQYVNPRVNRIINFLERKNIYKKYNLDRALEEWVRLKKESQNAKEIEGHVEQIIRLLSLKVSHDYDKQKDEVWRNPNATGNSLVFRSLLKFFVDGLDTEQHYKHFAFLSSQLNSHGISGKMSLDDAIIFTYIWNQLIIEGGLLAREFNASSNPNQGSDQGGVLPPPPPPSSSSTWSLVSVSEENERMVRNVVKAGNRIYPAAPPANEPLTINDWWLRQRQHSQNVYKIYNVIDALVKGCRKNGVETATIYEALVDEYRSMGRPLDAFELNMIDYVAYRMFGMIEHADPNRW